MGSDRDTEIRGNKMKRSQSLGTTPKSRIIKIKIGQVKIGVGFGDFHDSVPRFAFFGEILHPGLQVYLFRVWDFAIQVVKPLKW
jgi:hypothetical protein